MMEKFFEIMAQGYRDMGEMAGEILLRALVMVLDLLVIFGWMGIIAAAFLDSPWWLLLFILYPAVGLADKAANVWLEIYLEEKYNEWLNRKL